MSTSSEQVPPTATQGLVLRKAPRSSLLQWVHWKPTLFFKLEKWVSHTSIYFLKPKLGSRTLDSIKGRTYRRSGPHRAS
jgi:hypothetical protein